MKCLLFKHSIRPSNKFLVAIFLNPLWCENIIFTKGGSVWFIKY